MAKRIVLLGPPGVGKGTQAKLAAEKLSIPHISTGDMLRAERGRGSELGKKVGAIIDSGELVSDQLILEVIATRISEADCSNGYILDGFPRTVGQAEGLDRMLAQRGEKLTHVVLFEADLEKVLARLSGRRGTEARADDNEGIQRRRLEVYREQTAPLIDYYEQEQLLARVDGSGGINEVTANLLQALA